MKILKKILSTSVGLLAVSLLSCAHTVDMSNTGGGVASEVAVSIVSGGVNGAQTNVAALENLRAPEAFSMPEWISSAEASNYNCTTGAFTPATYTAAGTYTFAPGVCSVIYGNNKTASTSWNGVWTYNYGASCTGTGFLPKFQVNNCVITRTSPAAGISRSIIGPDLLSYAVTHNTNGHGTGWDNSITTANAGETLTCNNAACTTQTLVISGSHLTATVANQKLWDHTVTTNPGLTITTNAFNEYTVSGTVMVQHNIAKIESTSTFNNVVYGGVNGDCCFPTSGSVVTTYNAGSKKGESETMTFSSTCGEATLTTTGGNSISYPLLHCI